MTKDIVAPAGGIMTDEVGNITGEVTLEPALSPEGVVYLRVQYKGADEWYRVTDTEIKVDPQDAGAVQRAQEELLSRFG